MIKKIFSQLHTFVLWALASAIFWMWIFTFVTDTSPDKKITLYCLTDHMEDVQLAAKLEETMPEGLKMIQAHSFDYVMFGTDAFYRGDIFIIPASEIAEYQELLAPVQDEQGAKIYDAATKRGAAMNYINYADEDYYLFLGAGSQHLEDGKALSVAQDLLNLNEKGV